MRNHLALISILAGSAFLAASAHAEDNPATTNVFNADMSNPDLAALITSFQDVCLPFIVHTTDLPQSLNQQHHVKLLSQQGFEFQARDRLDDRVIIEPSREEWTPPTPPLDASALRGHANTSPGEFTLFNGATKPTIRQTGEIDMRALVPAKYKAVMRDIDSYSPKRYPRQTVSLGWNYASQNHPAKSCEIILDQASISNEALEASFVSKDPDWWKDSERESRWIQCSRDGADEFEFEVETTDGQLSLSVQRNDFYQPNICKKWLRVGPAFQ